MSMMQPAFARRPEGSAIRLAADRRRHKRIAVAMLGRFMRAGKREYPCRLNDISIGGAAIMAPVELAIGEKVVVYFDLLGGLEGVVCRVFDGGFAMTISATQHRREKLAAQLTWIANRTELEGIDDRRHERTIPSDGQSALQLDAGLAVPCTILNISLSGASIAVAARPPIGHQVLLGKTAAKVVRHHETGISIAFVKHAEPGAGPPSAPGQNQMPSI
jgi:PilZ domain